MAKPKLTLSPSHLHDSSPNRSPSPSALSSMSLTRSEGLLEFTPTHKVLSAAFPRAATTSFPKTPPSASESDTSQFPSQPLPSERDYDRVLMQLEHAVRRSGPVVRRGAVLREGQPLSFSLVTDEWQPVRVYAEGQRSPMQVFVQRASGKLICYLSTSQDPTERIYDDVSCKDVIVWEVGLHTTCVFLAFKCVADSEFAIRVKFGAATQRDVPPLTERQMLAQLDELRNNEAKRKALFAHVEQLLSERAKTRRTSQDHIRINIAVAGKAKEDESAHRAAARTKREEVRERHRQIVKEKKMRALFLKEERALRREARAQEAAAETLRTHTEQEQRVMLFAVFLAGATIGWAEEFERKREAAAAINRRMKAAMVLQRCYRKVLLTVNPKRLVRQHALQHLRLFLSLTGPFAVCALRESLFFAITESSKAHQIDDAIVRFDGRVRLVQGMWRKYQVKRRERLARLSLLWDEAVAELSSERKTKGKKRNRKSRKSEPDSDGIDRTAPLEAYLQSSELRYRKEISAFWQENRGKDVKAFVFAKVRKGRAVPLPEVPALRLPSLQEMKDIVRAAGYPSS